MTIPAYAVRRQTVRHLVNDLRNERISRADVQSMIDARLSRSIQNPRSQGFHTVRELAQMRLENGLPAFNQPGLLFGMLSDAAKYGMAGALMNLGITRDVLTTGASSGYPYIREDIDAAVEALYVDVFPGWARIPKRPANGIHHSFNVRGSLDAADVQYITELQTVPIGQAPPTRVTAPVALVGTVRGASWLEEQAVMAGGVLPDGRDVGDEEVSVGMEAVAYKSQTTFYRGITGSFASGKTGTDEYGVYNANGFNGLQPILANVGGNFNNLYLGSTSAQIMDQGGMPLHVAIGRMARKIANVTGKLPTAVHCSYGAVETLGQEGANIVRIQETDAQGVSLGVTVDAINTPVGRLPIIAVPGDSIGTYTAGAGSVYSGSPVEPVYVLSEDSMFFAYLGSPSPFTLQIPMGVDLTLADRTIIAYAAGLCIRAPARNGMIRTPAVNNL